ncbi:MAG: PEP-CTERM sorting domain-containing protein [Nitrospirota bacterium]
MSRAPQKSNRSAKGRVAAAVTAVLALVLGGVQASPAWALAVSEAYIFSDWLSPPHPPTSQNFSPFTLSPTAGYELGLNSFSVATSATALSGMPSLQVTDQLYYQSHSGYIDRYESGTSTQAGLRDRVNREIAVVDDGGFVNEGSDAAMNVDFSDGSWVALRTAENVAVSGLILFEDAGLDPFSLRYCYNGVCSLLFNGFSSSTAGTLTGAGGGFGTDDYAPGIDQAFWFVFDQSVTGGYFKIAETTNLNRYSEKLEVDFVGVTGAPARVSEPSTLLLLGSGLLGLPLLRRIRRR